MTEKTHNIGILNEKSLHADLKDWFSEPEDLIEEKIDGYTVDIVRGNRLIEIQTRNLNAIRKKIRKLLYDYQVEIILPIIYKKQIIKISKNGDRISQRKSPKTGRIEEIFKELIYFTEILNIDNFKMIVPLVNIDEIWLDDGLGSWRRKGWSINNKKLTSVNKVFEFKSHIDYLKFIPKSLSSEFTNKELSLALKLHIRVTRKMTYCLRKMDLLEISGKKGNANVYKISEKVVE